MIIWYTLATIVAIILAIILLHAIFLTICGLFVDPKKEYEHDNKFYRFLLYSSTAIMLRVFRIKLHVHGLEKIPTDTKPLFVGNHRSNFDPIIEWQVLRKWQPAFISKAENFQIPFYGKIIRRCCFMAIDRKDPRNAMHTIQKAAALLKQQEVSIGIYPEGTRSKSGELLPFHNGVFKIAQMANAPIVVVAIRGTQQIHKQVILHRSDIYIDIVDVIPAAELATMRTSAIGKRVQDALLSVLSVDKI